MIIGVAAKNLFHAFLFTDDAGESAPGVMWGPLVGHTSDEIGKPIEAFHDYWLASMSYPYAGSRLWRGIGEIAGRRDGLVLCSELVVVDEVDYPNLTTEHRLKFAILAALQVAPPATFAVWANRWIGGDRSMSSAHEAAQAAIAVKNVPATLAAQAAIESVRPGELGGPNATTEGRNPAVDFSACLATRAASILHKVNLSTFADRVVPPEVLALVPTYHDPLTVDGLAAYLRQSHGQPGVSIENAYDPDLQMETDKIKNVVYRDERGNPIGILRIILDGEGKPEFLHLAVKPARRRQGVACQLWRAAEDAGLDPLPASMTKNTLTPDGAAFVNAMAKSRRRRPNTPRCLHDR